MGKVRITGNAWTHAGGPMPAARHPELWFRPNRANLSESALLAAVDVKADLDVSTGAFWVVVEAGPLITYKPWMRWLVNPSEPDPERWAYGYEEWPFEVNPYPSGGPIDQLVRTEVSHFMVRVSLEDPAEGWRGWWLHAAPGDPLHPSETGSGELREVH